MLNDFARVDGPLGQYLIHTKTSTLIERASLLGAVIEHELGSPRLDLLEHPPEAVEKALEEFLSLQSLTIPNQLDSGMPVGQVSISPTLTCNLNCGYCYNYQGGTRRRSVASRRWRQRS
jgi:hypothetical protein